MTIDLDALEALEKKATPGPWWTEDSYPAIYAHVAGGRPNGEGLVKWSYYGRESTLQLHDVAFVAAARNALPELIRLARIGQRVERDAKRPDPLSQALNEGDGVYRP